MTIKIHVLRTGLVKVDRALTIYESARNPLAFTGHFRSHKNQILVPISSYLIEHPKGLVLIDTGWNENVRTNPKKELGRSYHISRGYLPAGWSIREQLHKFGYQPSDIDYVVMSHLHSDHVSGLPLVKDAKHIIVSKEELDVANNDKLHYLQHMWQGVPLKTFEFDQTGVGPYGKSMDLFGDGSMQFIFTPGHSSGLTSTIIKGSDGREVFLATDTAYSNQGISKMTTPGIAWNRDLAYETIGWVNYRSKQPQVIETLTNHDQNIPEKTITLS